MMTFKIHTYNVARVRIHRNEMRFFIFPSLGYETHKKYFYHQLTADDCFGWMFNNCRSSFALFLLSFSYGCQLCNAERCDEKVKESNIESHTHTHSNISWICLFFKNIFLFSPHENFTIKSNFNTMAMIQYKKQPICVFLLMALLVIAIFFYSYGKKSTTYHNSHPINKSHTLFEPHCNFHNINRNYCLSWCFLCCSSVASFPDFELFPVLPSNECEMIAFNSRQTHCLFHDKEI